MSFALLPVPAVGFPAVSFWLILSRASLSSRLSWTIMLHMSISIARLRLRMKLMLATVSSSRFSSRSILAHGLLPVVPGQLHDGHVEHGFRVDVLGEFPHEVQELLPDLDGLGGAAVLAEGDGGSGPGHLRGDGALAFGVPGGGHPFLRGSAELRTVGSAGGALPGLQHTPGAAARSFEFGYHCRRAGQRRQEDVMAGPGRSAKRCGRHSRLPCLGGLRSWLYLLMGVGFVVWPVADMVLARRFETAHALLIMAGLVCCSVSLFSFRINRDAGS